MYSSYTYYLYTFRICPSAYIEQRVQEAAKLGFKRVIIPKNNIGGWTYPEGIQVIGVTTVHEALSFRDTRRTSPVKPTSPI
jgi:predicted ATP-dependent serine protease